LLEEKRGRSGALTPALPGSPDRETSKFEMKKDFDDRTQEKIAASKKKGKPRHQGKIFIIVFRDVSGGLRLLRYLFPTGKALGVNASV